MSEKKYEETTSGTRQQAADHFLAIGNELASGQPLHLTINGETVTVEVPDPVLVEVEVKIGDAESKLEIELKWMTKSGA